MEWILDLKLLASKFWGRTFKQGNRTRLCTICFRFLWMKLTKRLFVSTIDTKAILPAMPYLSLEKFLVVTYLHLLHTIRTVAIQYLLWLCSLQMQYQDQLVMLLFRYIWFIHTQSDITYILASLHMRGLLFLEAASWQSKFKFYCWN